MIVLYSISILYRANIVEETGGSSDHYQVKQNIYLIGYSISLVALLVATSIFIYFKWVETFGKSRLIESGNPILERCDVSVTRFTPIYFLLSSSPTHVGSSQQSCKVIITPTQAWKSVGVFPLSSLDTSTWQHSSGESSRISKLAKKSHLFCFRMFVEGKSKAILSGFKTIFLRIIFVCTSYCHVCSWRLQDEVSSLFSNRMG